MEKVLQILLVFALMMLVIWRSIRGKEDRYRRFSYLYRARQPLARETMHRLIAGSTDAADRVTYGAPEDADIFLADEDSRLLFSYRAEGKLMVHQWSQGRRKRELQELSVPMDCSGLDWDPEEGRIYLEDEGYCYVYGPEE